MSTKAVTERSAAIGSAIRRCREARGWSQAELGARCNPPYTGPAIAFMEAGRYRFTRAQLRCLAAALDEPVETLTADYCPSCGRGLGRDERIFLLRRALREVQS